MNRAKPGILTKTPCQRGNETTVIDGAVGVAISTAAWTGIAVQQGFVTAILRKKRRWRAY